MLLNGENVEPQPIEDALCCSPYIKFAGEEVVGASCERCTKAGIAHKDVPCCSPSSIEPAGEGGARWCQVAAATPGVA